MRSLTLHRSSVVVALCVAMWASASPALADDEWIQQGQDSGGASLNAAQTGIAAADLPLLSEQWSRHLDFRDGPTDAAISQGQLYLARTVLGRDGFKQSQVLRLDLKTGSPVWKTNSVESYVTPLVTPDAVIVGGVSNVGDKKSFVRALDRETGDRRWHHVFPGPGQSVLAPHLSDGVAYLATVHGSLAALDPSTGAVHWQKEIDLDLHGMVVDRGVMVVSHNDGMVALAADDGRELWRYETLSNGFVSHRPMIVKGTAYAMDGSGYVHAVDLATGVLRWKRLAQAGDTAHGMAPLASDGQRIFVLSGVVRPSLSALDPGTGDTLWNVDRSGSWSQGLMVSNGVLYLATGHLVVAFDAGDGTALPMAKLRAQRGDGLSIAQGYLIVSGGPVRAYALAEAGR